MCVCVYMQSGQDSQDDLSCRSFFANETLVIRLFCKKSPMTIRHPMTPRHPVVMCVYILYGHLRYTSRGSWVGPACAAWSAGVNACVYVCIYRVAKTHRMP